jgi:5-methyltetrahydropteroyltriglutamate--homocysteine methyltransferase
VLSGTRFDRYLLEYDDERSGDFEPLREVPENRVVVLGLVTTKRPRLEDEDVLKRRIADAARIIPLERLALSPQCGFASTMEGNKLTQDEQRAKLDLVGRVARSVFG